MLVTGHTGFKGSWLLIWLQKMGAIVAGYALEPIDHPNLSTMSDACDGIQSVIGDVRDRDNLVRSVQAFEPEIVLHMAAQALVRESYRAPQETWSVNVMGTLNLLEAVRESGSAHSVVIVTSDKCYENFEHDRPYVEADPMGGHDPYSSSKGAAELLTSSYRRSYFSDEQPDIAVATARAGNVIGGGDYSVDRIIPDLVRGRRSGDVVIIRNPRATRPWLHVLDVLCGYLVLAQQQYRYGHEFAEAWNFGPGKSDIRTVEDIANKFSEKSTGKFSWRRGSGDEPHEASNLVLDASKSRTRLGWSPRMSFDESIELTLDWYIAVEDSPGVARDLTLRQIEKYANT